MVPAVATVTATDNCGGLVDLEFTETEVPGACSNRGSILRKWTATDPAGNATTFTQTITVNDAQAPVFSQPFPPVELSLSCGEAIPTAVTLTATDNCGVVDIEFSEMDLPGAGSNGGNLIVRTWTASDVCGNATNFIQMISSGACLCASISGPTLITSGQSSTLTASGGTSYLWSTGANTPSINVSTAGTYSVTATDASGCTGTASATVVVFCLPNIAISGDLSLCTGQTSTLTATGGTSYLWSTDATTNTINITAAAVYSVTATDANGCTGTASVTATQNPTVTPGISGDLDFCQGQSSTLTALGGTSYLWSTGVSAPSINTSVAGTYLVTATDASGCTGTASATVGVFSLPNAAIAGNLSLCAGSTSTLTASGGLSYLWSTGASTTSITVNTAGMYSVTVTNDDGCTGTGSVVVVSNSLPTVSITGDLNICTGETTQLTASSGGLAYAWSTGASTQSISISAGGIYSVTFTDANSCSNSASATVNQNPAIVLAPVVIATSCNGGSNGAINLSASGGIPSFQFVWNNGATSQNLTNIPAGYYTVTATDASGCTTAASATVSQPVAIQIISTITPVDCNLGANGAVALAVSGGIGAYSYAWSNGATTKDLLAVPIGSYTVTVTDANGCTAVASDNVAIDLNKVQPLSISCPSTVPILTANASCQASLSDYISLAIISGGCAGNINPILQSPAAGAIANPGRVLVQLSVTNDIGESASCMFHVQISGNCSGN
jgi:hypothetical protein